MIWLWLACVSEELRYPELTAGLMGRLDGDGDGEVSAAEYTSLALPDQPMSACDSDGDRALSPLEVEACFLTLNPTRIQAERRPIPERAPRPGRPP